MPRVDDLSDALQSSCLFSTLDLRSGYWQVSVAPNDREKTAFVKAEIHGPFFTSISTYCMSRTLENKIIFETLHVIMSSLFPFQKDGHVQTSGEIT